MNVKGEDIYINMINWEYKGVMQYKYLIKRIFRVLETSNLALN